MNIRLRKIEPTDLPFLYLWENDHTMWADADNHNPLSQQDLRNYIESTTGDIYHDGQLRLIIELYISQPPHSDNIPDQQNIVTIGCIDLFDFDPRNRKAAIGMYIAPEHRAQGFGTQALTLLEEYAYSHLNLRMLYAIISINNLASSNLFRSHGYEATAHLRNWTLEGDAIVWQKLHL